MLISILFSDDSSDGFKPVMRAFRSGRNDENGR